MYWTELSEPATLQYRQRALSRSKPAATELSIERIASRDNLLVCFEDARNTGGQAAGKDGITYGALSPREAGEIFGVVSETILAGRYRPSETRDVLIPKSGGRGHRVLSIGTIVDRVVAKALNEALTPLWERVWLPGSYGFRKGRDRFDMLAGLTREIEQEGRTVVAIDDVRNAFDNVVIAHVLGAHDRLFAETGTVGQPGGQDRVARIRALLENVLAGRERNTRGIPQGNPVSPTALNGLLHYVHDRPLNGGTRVWARYADNLCYPAKTETEGNQTLSRSTRLLNRSSLELKGEDGVTDLKLKDARILGFTLRLRGKVELGLTPEAWQDLTRGLEELHGDPDPAYRATRLIGGWVNAYGPAFEKVEQVDRISSVAASCGFREIDPTALRRKTQCAVEAWTRRLQSAARGPGSTAPP